MFNLNTHQKKALEADRNTNPSLLSPRDGYDYWYRQVRRRGYSGVTIRLYPGYPQAMRAFNNRKLRVEPGGSSLREKKLEIWLKKWLTIEGFRSWVESLAENAIVGTLRSACNCPIANYLVNLDGDFDEAAITCEGVELIGNDLQIHFKTARWAVDFIRPADSMSQLTVLTREQALEILDTIAA